MSIISGLINNEVDVYSKTSDKYGDYTYTKVYSNMPCRWEEESSIQLSREAHVKDFSIRMWFLPTYTIEENYEIRKDGKKYRVVGVDKLYDLGGNVDHKKAYLE